MKNTLTYLVSGILCIAIMAGGTTILVTSIISARDGAPIMLLTNLANIPLFFLWMYSMDKLEKSGELLKEQRLNKKGKIV